MPRPNAFVISQGNDTSGHARSWFLKKSASGKRQEAIWPWKNTLAKSIFKNPTVAILAKALLHPKHSHRTLARKKSKYPGIELYSLSGLKRILSKQGMQLVAKVQDDHELEYQVIGDYGRYPYTIGSVNYNGLTRKEQLEEAGFTPYVIATLFRQSPDTSLVDTEGLFWFDADGHKIWGCNMSSWFFVEGIPNQLFGKESI